MGTHEISVGCNGWSPASLVGAETLVRGVPLLVYSIHIPERPANAKSAEGSAAAFTGLENSLLENVVLKILKNPSYRLTHFPELITR